MQTKRKNHWSIWPTRAAIWRRNVFIRNLDHRDAHYRFVNTEHSCNFWVKRLNQFYRIILNGTIDICRFAMGSGVCWICEKKINKCEIHTNNSCAAETHPNISIRFPFIGLYLWIFGQQMERTHTLICMDISFCPPDFKYIIDISMLFLRIGPTAFYQWYFLGMFHTNEISFYIFRSRLLFSLNLWTSRNKHSTIEREAF